MTDDSDTQTDATDATAHPAGRIAAAPDQGADRRRDVELEPIGISTGMGVAIGAALATIAVVGALPAIDAAWPRTLDGTVLAVAAATAFVLGGVVGWCVQRVRARTIVDPERRARLALACAADPLTAIAASTVISTCGGIDAETHDAIVRDHERRRVRRLGHDADDAILRLGERARGRR